MVVVVCTGCQSAPENIIVVDDFEVDRYLGKWYEIARFDFIHEKNMNNVTAEYSLNKDGTITTIKENFFKETYEYIGNKIDDIELKIEKYMENIC